MNAVRAPQLALGSFELRAPEWDRRSRYGSARIAPARALEHLHVCHATQVSRHHRCFDRNRRGLRAASRSMRLSRVRGGTTRIGWRLAPEEIFGSPDAAANRRIG